MEVWLSSFTFLLPSLQLYPTLGPAKLSVFHQKLSRQDLFELCSVFGSVGIVITVGTKPSSSLNKWKILYERKQIIQRNSMENLIQQTDHLSQNVFLAPGHICLTVVFLPSSQPYSWRVLHSQASTKAPPPPITHILL